MSDQFTEVTTEGWLRRLGGSRVAALIGLILIPASIILLYWNEGRAVDASTALHRGAASVVEVTTAAVEPPAEGRLVHLSGMMQPTTSARDPVFSVTGDGLIRLQRTVEMYQWKERTSSQSHESVGGSKTTETTYTYDHVWSAQPIASGSFRYPNGHQNPPMSLQSAIFDGGTVKLGAYQVEPAVLSRLTAFAPVQPGVTPPAGYQPDGNQFYHGADPAQPAIGDVRVSFAGIPAQTVSVVAAQSGGRLTPYRDANGYTIVLAEPGVVPAAALFHDQASSEQTLTWILRAVGFLMMLIGFVCVTRPLSMVFAVLPPLEWLVGAGAFLVALTLAIPITLLTIAIAWVVHRPLIGGGLLLAAVASMVLLRRLHRPSGPRAPVAS